MAFLRFADARIVHPRVTKTQWQNIRTAAKKTGSSDGDLGENLVQRASELFEKKFDPKQFLLTHCTIVASVDTYSPPGIKTGSVMENGFRVNRKYSDFRITPETDKFINNNGDAWPRGVLLKAYKTFIGGHNFCEHIQDINLSRGRIIDACVRDVGETLYVDILIATDRKHKDLIKAIETGKMATLSMGCTCDYTVCTKCGHVAADETELCFHVRHEKGNVFFDEQGHKHRVAETCGHTSSEPTGGVTFIEASWVEAPAFTGAVLRNVIKPTTATDEKVAQVLAMPLPQWAEDSYAKAAAVKDGVVRHGFVTPPIAGGFLAGWADEEGGPAEEEAPAEETPTEEAPAEETPKSPFKDVEDALYKSMLDKVQKRLKDDLSNSGKSELPHTPGDSSNENVNKVAAAKLYEAGLDAIVKTASSDVALVDSIAAYNNSVGVHLPIDIYRAALKVGNPITHGTVKAYKQACQKALGRVPHEREAQVLLRLGRMLFRRSSSESLRVTVAVAKE